MDRDLGETAGHLDPAERLEVAEIYDRWSRQLRQSVAALIPEFEMVRDQFGDRPDAYREEAASRLEKFATMIRLAGHDGLGLQEMADLLAVSKSSPTRLN